MIYTYLILGILCCILSGMWFGTICTDYYDGVKIQVTQYVMTLITFATGIFQFTMIFN